MSESKTDKHIYSDDSPEQLRKANPWKRIAEEYEKRGYKDYRDTVHPDDKPVVDEYNKTAKDEHRLQLHLPPEPFWGNPLTAEVAILMLNPGYVELCNELYNDLHEDEKKMFIKAKCSTLSIQDKWCVPNGDDMDPDLADILNRIGEYYWTGKTGDGGKLGKLFKEFPCANKKIAIIQLLGYHSKRYKAVPKKLLEGKFLFPTQEYAIRLVRYLIKQDKLIIIARGKRIWYECIPELANYEEKGKVVFLKNYRNTTISPGNCNDGDWEKITTALKSKKSRAVGDIHPNGKWVWTEYAPGKFDWRVIKSKACQ